MDLPARNDAMGIAKYIAGGFYLACLTTSVAFGIITQDLTIFFEILAIGMLVFAFQMWLSEYCDDRCISRDPIILSETGDNKIEILLSKYMPGHISGYYVRLDGTLVAIAYSGNRIIIPYGNCERISIGHRDSYSPCTFVMNDCVNRSLYFFNHYDSGKIRTKIEEVENLENVCDESIKNAYEAHCKSFKTGTRIRIFGMVLFSLSLIIWIHVGRFSGKSARSEQSSVRNHSFEIFLL